MKDFIKKEWGMSNTVFMRNTTFFQDSIPTNWTLKHISVKGQIVVKTCQNGTLTYIKYHDIETEVEEQMENGNQKTHRNDCEQSRDRKILEMDEKYKNRSDESRGAPESR